MLLMLVFCTYKWRDDGGKIGPTVLLGFALSFMLLVGALGVVTVVWSAQVGAACLLCHPSLQ